MSWEIIVGILIGTVVYLFVAVKIWEQVWWAFGEPWYLKETRLLRCAFCFLTIGRFLTMPIIYLGIGFGSVILYPINKLRNLFR